MASAVVACNIHSNLRITDAILPAERDARPALSTMAFWMLIHALHDASRCSNRRVASNAVRWIRARTDWTRIALAKRMERWGAPAPPVDVRTEHVLSFEWCCGLLNLNPERIREHGLPTTMHHKWLPDAGGLSSWRTWRSNRPKPSPPRQRGAYRPRKRLPDDVVLPTVRARSLPTTREYPGYVAYCNVVNVMPMTAVQWRILSR
jgi:hypothetical protein